MYAHFGLFTDRYDMLLYKASIESELCKDFMKPLYRMGISKVPRGSPSPYREGLHEDPIRKGLCKDYRGFMKTL